MRIQITTYFFLSAVLLACGPAPELTGPGEENLTDDTSELSLRVKVRGTVNLFNPMAPTNQYVPAVGARVCAIEKRNDGAVVIRTDIACSTTDATGSYVIRLPKFRRALVASFYDAPAGSPFHSVPNAGGTLWYLDVQNKDMTTVFYHYPLEVLALLTNPQNPTLGPDLTKGAITFNSTDGGNHIPKLNQVITNYVELAGTTISANTAIPPVYLDAQGNPDYTASATSTRGVAVMPAVAFGTYNVHVDGHVSGLVCDYEFNMPNKLVHQGANFTAPVFPGLITSTGIWCALHR